jgi:hypothetical protein
MPSDLTYVTVVTYVTDVTWIHTPAHSPSS